MSARKAALPIDLLAAHAVADGEALAQGRGEPIVIAEQARRRLVELARIAEHDGLHEAARWLTIATLRTVEHDGDLSARWRDLLMPLAALARTQALRRTRRRAAMNADASARPPADSSATPSRLRDGYLESPAERAAAPPAAPSDEQLRHAFERTLENARAD